MPVTVAIGIQDFGKIRENDYFYIDKTSFIKEWWESGDCVTLINRPRRFGKTLTMSMLEHFFSVRYADKGEIFEGLAVWKEEKYRKLQGTYPVISLSFANIKEKSYESARKKICQILSDVYVQYAFLKDSAYMTEMDRAFFDRISPGMGDVEATMALNHLSDYLYRYYGKKAIILLDEYDTPMQEAYVDGYWDELAGFTRSLFNAAFKTNPYLERAVMTGITRTSKESIFSDLNNLKVITTTSAEYADAFGFTEREVFTAMDGIGRTEKAEVKRWYDGFTFGEIRDIYNPWSVLNFLDTGKLSAYWANTSSNSLVSKLIREGSRTVKAKFESLLKGEHIFEPIDEQIIYNQLNGNEKALWSLLLASGYLKVISYQEYMDVGPNELPEYELALTNHEVLLMFRTMVREWFAEAETDYNDFIKVLLLDDKKAMNVYMNRVALSTFSFFDTGRRASEFVEPERFYHGFVLGLLVDLSGRYVIQSNRESGFGRYDVMLEPLRETDDAIIIEFKAYDPDDGGTLQDTVSAALKQITEKKYEQTLYEKGIPAGRIRRYGFAFEGKKVLIG